MLAMWKVMRVSVLCICVQFIHHLICQTMRRRQSPELLRNEMSRGIHEVPGNSSSCNSYKSQRIVTNWITCRALIDHWLMPFAAYIAAETPSAFQRAGQLPKLPALFRGGPRPPPSTWFLGPMWVILQMASWLFSRFCKAHPCGHYTDVQTTLRVTSVAVGRILCIACTWCSLIKR